MIKVAKSMRAGRTDVAEIVHQLRTRLGPSELRQLGGLGHLLMPVLRGGLDACVARQPQGTACRLTLLEPSRSHQLEMRALARTRALDVDMDDDEAGAIGEASGEASGSKCERARWTTVASGAKLLLELTSLHAGFCYLFHLNDRDELSLVFPSEHDRDNGVCHPNGVQLVPSRFGEGGEQQYLSVHTAADCASKRDTYYLLSTSTRLEDLDGLDGQGRVGPLPMRLEKIPAAQARAVLGAISRHLSSGARPSCGRDGGGDVVMTLTSLMMNVINQVTEPPMPPPAAPEGGSGGGGGDAIGALGGDGGGRGAGDLIGGGSGGGGGGGGGGGA
jgi:hypothetical protein